MQSIREMLTLFPNNQNILEAVIKLEDHIATGQKIMVSVSGGSDSDIVVDMVERVGYNPGQVVYAWFDTGLEYEATKRHLNYLENRYGITIERRRAKKPIPLAVKEFGVPFLSKLNSTYIGRLQAHNFEWEDGIESILSDKYPRCVSALKWWCNEWGLKSSFNINVSSGLKEFIKKNPPPAISDKCCTYAKKNIAYELEKEFSTSLVITGVRKAEHGVRSNRIQSCYTPKGNHAAQFRPLFYFTDADKLEYEKFCSIRHSDCYSVYGLKRTGCACCPFGSGFEQELEVVKQHEPKLYQAAINIFGESYEYTRKYREFKEQYKKEKRSIKGGD